MIIISLFDGMSCGQIALNKLKIKYDAYYASEIEKNCIAVTQKNYPKTIQLGDVRKLSPPSATVLLGGSPCRSFSLANINRDSFNSENGKLFFEYVRILNKVIGKYFLYENVANMKDSDRDFISSKLGVQPLLIDSARFSPQIRKRYYWTNIPVDMTKLPTNNSIMKDIIDFSYAKKPDLIGRNVVLKKKEINPSKSNQIGYVDNVNRGNRIYSIEGKGITLTASSGGVGSKTGLYLVGDTIRKLSPIEAERMQNVPDNYTEGVPDHKRLEMLGNGWTCDTIAWIFSFMK